MRRGPKGESARERAMQSDNSTVTDWRAALLGRKHQGGTPRGWRNVRFRIGWLCRSEN